LRAERAGNGNGRIYTISITVNDGCNPAVTSSTQVIVAHNAGSDNITRSTTGETEQSEINIVPLKIEGKELQKGLQIQAFPNPAKTNFVVKVSSNDRKGVIQMQISDVTGRIMESRTIAPGETITFGDTYLPGSYYIRVIQGTEQKQLKLIKMGN